MVAQVLLHEHGQRQPLPTWHIGSPSPALLHVPGPQSAGPTQIPRRAVGSHPTCAPIRRAGAPSFLGRAKGWAPAMCCSRAEAHGGHSSDPKDQVLGGETGPRHTLAGSHARGTGGKDTAQPRGHRGEKRVVDRGGLQAGACKGPEARACWCQAQGGRSQGRVVGGKNSRGGAVMANPPASQPVLGTPLSLNRMGSQGSIRHISKGNVPLGCSKETRS